MPGPSLRRVPCGIAVIFALFLALSACSSSRPPEQRPLVEPPTAEDYRLVRAADSLLQLPPDSLSEGDRLLIEVGEERRQRIERLQRAQAEGEAVREAGRDVSNAATAYILFSAILGLAGAGIAYFLATK